MQTTTIRSSELGHRWDARYHILHQRHKAAAEELFEKYTLEELVELAKQLPINEAAWNTLVPGVYHKSGQVKFAEWLLSQTHSRAANPDHWAEEKFILTPKTDAGLHRRRKEMSVYCAAAAHGASSIVLEEILEERKKQLVKIRDLKTLLARVKERGCEALHNAIKGATDGRQNSPEAKPGRQGPSPG